MEGFLAGLHGSPFHGPSVEFKEYRDYRPGDDPRHLDWRLFARSDRLCIRRFEQETNLRGYLLLDTSASMAYRGARARQSKLECAKTVALAFGWALLRQNDAVGVLAQGPPEPGPRLDGRAPRCLPRLLKPSQKPHQVGQLLRVLADLAAEGGSLLPDLLARAFAAAARRSLLVVVSDFLEPTAALQAAFERARFEGHECLCLQVLDPDELDFPFSGAHVFEDPESGERRRFVGEEARERYRARLERFLREYRDLWNRLQVRNVLIRTDEEPGAALARGLSRRR
jgi:uncharacterized protein (DUF58 family)